MTDTPPAIDPEIAAMTDVSRALADLGEEARGRVLRWAAERYGITYLKPAHNKPKDDAEEDNDSRGGGSGDSQTFTTIDELFEVASAKTNTQKALVAAYWFQVIEGNVGFQSQALNTALKNMGIGIANITDALSSAESAKPALVMQVAKTGKTRQARKTYKLTSAGISAVKALLTDAD